MPLLSPSTSTPTAANRFLSPPREDLLLLCGEDAESLMFTDDSVPMGVEDHHHHSREEDDDDEEEMVEVLVERQGNYTPGPEYASRFRSLSLDPLARRQSVEWILKVSAYYRFRPLTAYLAVNYMDRFLSTHTLPQANGWPLQLLSVACLSLSAKMEEILVPSLIDLQVEDARFIFEPRTICRMEILVLTALNWRLRSITPFTFMDFFSSKVVDRGATRRTGYLASHASRIILEATRDIEFLEYDPSTLAAAAIVCASDEIPSLLSPTDPGTAVSWCNGLDRDDIVDCCHLMKQVVVAAAAADLPRTPPRILPQLRVSTPINMTSGVSSAASSPPSYNKRRKIDDCLWVEDDDGTDDKKVMP